MTASTRYALAADVILQIAGDEALLVNLNDEDLFALNATGAEIVQGVADGQDADTVIDELARAYQADRSAVAADVTALIAELLARGLLLAR